MIEFLKRYVTVPIRVRLPDNVSGKIWLNTELFLKPPLECLIGDHAVALRV